MIDVVVMFFLFGLAAGLLRSELKLPASLYDTLSLFLLLAIGLKGGEGLAQQALGPLLPQLIAVIALGVVQTLIAFAILRAVAGFGRADAAATAAHYGSVSVATFAVGVNWLVSREIAFEPQLTIFLAVMEVPAIVVGIVLARGVGRQTQWGALAHEAFLGKTVHAGEDYGPESIFQAIGDLHADRIGHGTWLFEASRIRNPRIADPKRYVEDLSEHIADKRITIEVCLTSNQQTVPELADDLRRHPFAEMRRRRLSTTFCTDNRLVSHTTVSQEIARAVEAFRLEPREVRDILIYGFKRSFYPGTYLEKRDYVRKVIDVANRVLAPNPTSPRS